MIWIRAFYGPWKDVTEEEARQFVKNMLSGITVGSYTYQVQLIETKHLQGTTVKELIE